jgi:DNA-binding NarL/FixJ family response regulator
MGVVYKAEDTRLYRPVVLKFLPEDVAQDHMAARQIRKLAPKSKILFVSGESAPDILRAAFSGGGSGYVAKMDAAEGLWAGIETNRSWQAVCQSQRNGSVDLTDASDSGFRYQNLAALSASKSEVLLRLGNGPDC